MTHSQGSARFELLRFQTLRHILYLLQECLNQCPALDSALGNGPLSLKHCLTLDNNKAIVQAQICYALSLLARIK